MVHGFLNVYMLVLTSAYCGSLISFLSIEVYPDPPNTFDEVATEVINRDLNVAVCCQEVIEVLGESSLQSFQTMTPRVYQPVGWDEGFVKTSKGQDVYIYARNALEITRRINTYRFKRENSALVSCDTRSS